MAESVQRGKLDTEYKTEYIILLYKRGDISLEEGTDI